MKTQLFSFFLALVASVGTISASAIKVDDNSLEDWKNLPAGYVFESVCPDDAALLGLKSVKVYADRDYINILVEPNMDEITDLSWVPFHIYINADNSDATGGCGYEFTDANTDILCETSLWNDGGLYSYNPAVFKWWGEVGGSGWGEWTDPSVEHDDSDFWGAMIGEGQLPVGKSQYVDGKFEIQLLRELLGTVHPLNDTEFGIGFDILQNWEPVGILPLVSPTDENPNGHAHKMQIKIVPNPTEINGIQYILNDENHTATVTKGEYHGKIVIPTQVINDHTIYDVTHIDPNAFGYEANNVIVFVPRSLSSAYINAWYLRYWIYDAIDGDFIFQHAEGEIGVEKDPSTIDPEACDNTIQRCWQVYISYTYQGTNYTEDFSVWVTERELVEGLQANLNAIETQGAEYYSYVRVRYMESSLRSEESCRNHISEGNYPHLLSEPAGWYLIGCLDYSEEITLPGKVNGEVYGIGQGGVFEGSHLTSIVLPAGLTSIGDDAFYGCTELASINIPSSVTRIGDVAFYNCKSLTSIAIPNSVTKMGNQVLFGCTGLTSIAISANVPRSVEESGIIESIGGYGFTSNAEYRGQEFPNLKTLEAPAWFLDAPEPLWMYCPKTLEEIVVNNGELTENALAVIRRSAKNLKKVNVAAATNTELADEAFSGLYNVSELTLPANLTRVSYMAVAGCKNLLAVEIPASVEEIDQSAFEDCRSLRTITFGGTKPAAVPGRSAVSVNATSQLRRIGNWAFYNAHELQHLEIPEGVEEIGDAAFYGCTYLVDLVLPASVRAIGDNCFALCSKLTRIVVSSPEPPEIQAKTFYDVKRRIPVYVPDDSVDTYKSDDLWGEFDIQGISTMEDALQSIGLDASAAPVKIFWGGRLLIVRNGHTYTLQGQLLQ